MFETLISIRQNARCHNAEDYSMKLLVLSGDNVLLVKFSHNREVLSWVDRETRNHFSCRQYEVRAFLYILRSVRYFRKRK
jgi:hypothetical protein